MTPSYLIQSVFFRSKRSTESRDVIRNNNDVTSVAELWRSKAHLPSNHSHLVLAWQTRALDQLVLVVYDQLGEGHEVVQLCVIGAATLLVVLKPQFTERLLSKGC